METKMNKFFSRGERPSLCENLLPLIRTWDISPEIKYEIHKNALRNLKSALFITARAEFILVICRTILESSHNFYAWEFCEKNVWFANS
jgi:hypothetical protein